MKLYSNSNKIQEQRRNSYDVSGFGFQHARRPQSLFFTLTEDDIETKINHSIRHTLEDSNSTLISLYPFKNNQSESIPTPMEIDIQRSSSLTSSPSSHIFTIFKLSKQHRMHTSLSKASLLKTMDGSIMTNKSNENEAIVQQTQKTKSKKIRRFRSFFRCIFCQVIPAQSKSPVAAIDFKRQSLKTLNDASIPDIKKPATLNSISQ
ncbi:unnamed protein product, partial [Rotaria magnacalcarata]